MTDSRYFNKYNSRKDLMHCLDHHGVFGVIIASIIWFLCCNDGVPTLGATQQERLDTVNGVLKSFYRKNPGVSSRLDTLKMKNIFPSGTDKYAALGGATVKAANTRQAIPFLKDLADRYLTDGGNLDHVLIHELIKRTIEFNRLTYNTM